MSLSRFASSLLRGTLLAGLAALAFIPPTASSQTQGFESFRLVRTRNVFNPDRRATRSDSPRPRREDSGNRSNVLSLTGTLITPEKAMAFFSGSRSEYNKVMAAPGTIAGLEVKAITATQVELQHGDKKIVLTPGQQVSLGDDGPGDVTSSPSAAPVASNPFPTTTSAPGSPAPSGDRSELLRRMMERRQQETSK